jgi:phytoene synthase
VSLDQAYAHCEAAARAGARDRWLAALYAPPPRRRALHALIAFELEMSRLRASVRDPRAGEIRLVWWREALTGERPGEAQGNPVAAALLDTLAQAPPPPHLIANAIAGRQFDFYDDVFPATVELEAYLGQTRSGLLQIAALALSEGRDLGSAEASGLAGVGLGLVDWLCGLAAPRPAPLIPADNLAAHGASAADLRERRMNPALAAALREIAMLARRRLSEAEAARRLLPPALAPAYAGLAAAPLRLDAAERSLARAFEAEPTVAAWRRQWALWRWMRRG